MHDLRYVRWDVRGFCRQELEEELGEAVERDRVLLAELCVDPLGQAHELVEGGGRVLSAES